MKHHGVTSFTSLHCPFSSLSHFHKAINTLKTHYFVHLAINVVEENKTKSMSSASWDRCYSLFAMIMSTVRELQ